MATVTVRLIRSFEYRTVKPVVLHHVDVSLTVHDFITHLKQDIQTRPGILAPFRTHSYDTLKVFCHAHGMKPNDLVINTENDSELILQGDKLLSAYGITNETELSFFSMQDYEAYKTSVQTKWI
jgi:hypothetical protein